MSLAMAGPAAANETIGSMEAAIDGEMRTWRTLSVPSEGTATAQFRDLGGVTSVSVQGHPEEGPVMSDVLSFEATLMGEGAGASVISATVSHFPGGMSEPFFVSDESGVAPTIEWTRLEVSDGGMAEGRFSATLCRRASMFAEIDLGDCRDVEGTFSTQLRSAN